MSGQIKAKAIAAAMRCIHMSGEGPAYRQRLEDFRDGYMAGHAAHTRWANKMVDEYRKATGTYPLGAAFQAKPDSEQK